MDYVRVKGFMANPLDHNLKVELEFIADTGAIYTVIPKRVAERLRLKKLGRRKLKTTNGSVVEFPVSEAYMSINGEV